MEIVENLGKGATGEVSKVYNKNTGKFYAIKKVNIEDEDERESALIEIEIMKQVNTVDNDGIIKYIGYYIAKEKLAG